MLWYLIFARDNLCSIFTTDDDATGATHVKPSKDLAYFHFNLFIDECEEIQFCYFHLDLLYSNRTWRLCTRKNCKPSSQGQMQFHLKDQQKVPY